MGGKLQEQSWTPNDVERAGHLNLIYGIVMLMVTGTCGAITCVAVRHDNVRPSAYTGTRYEHPLLAEEANNSV